MTLVQITHGGHEADYLAFAPTLLPPFAHLTISTKQFHQAQLLGHEGQPLCCGEKGLQASELKVTAEFAVNRKGKLI
jgi:hypothetical protein